MSTSTTNTVHPRQDEHRSRPHPRSNQQKTDQNCPRSDAMHATPNSGAVAKLAFKKAPPPSSLPLPPPKSTPRDAKPVIQAPRAPVNVSASSPRLATGEMYAADRIGVDVTADVARNSKALHTSMARTMPVVGSRKSGPNPQAQSVVDEFGENVVPASYRRQQVCPADKPPPPPPKSGLLKRLTTRLGNTRSSPSLRPLLATSEEPSKGLDTLPPHEEQQEDEKLHANATPVPARTAPLMPDEKPAKLPRLQQTLNGRLSLAALAERRAEKREAKEREEQRATHARRAAALAKSGLLPASRRYSIALPADAPNLDPFAKDGIQWEGESDDGIEVQDGSTAAKKEGSKEECEGGFSAAEAVIREWRERNGRDSSASVPQDAQQPQDSNGEQKLLQDDSKQVQTDDGNVQDQPSLPGVEASSTCPADGTPVSSSPQTLSTPTVPPDIAPVFPIAECSTPVRASSSSVEKSDAALVPSRLDSQRSALPHPPSKMKTRSIKKSMAARDENAEIAKSRDEVVDKTKPETDERVVLGAWRFPAVASSSLLVGSSGMSTPRVASESEGVETPSPASSKSVSSASTVVASPSQGSSSLAKDVPPPPPPKPKKDDSVAQEEKNGCNSFSQIPPLLPTASSPVPVPSSRNTSSTAPATPNQRSRVQKKTNGPVAPSQALTLNLPALSPTTSTSTSTSDGSALPRTPSMSSHGHNSVRVLDAPLENEEDALLSGDPVALPSITESNPKSKVTGVKEFGELARRSELDPEAFEIGALPPVPPSSFRDPTGAVRSPVVVVERSGGDRRKRTTLFGRRRTTQNDPPMIAIPENNAGMPLAGKVDSAVEAEISGRPPRHASSLTNLRRTVTSVAAGFTGAAGIAMRSSSKMTPKSSTLSENAVGPQQKKGSFPSRDRSPHRGATMPNPRPMASPRSNTYSANSLSPTSAETRTPNQYTPGVGLRVRPLNPTMHSRGSILLETHAIEDEESRRLAELAFLD